MYFSAVLLVFLAPVFTNSMQRREFQRPTYIPLNFAYTYQVEAFLQQVTQNFKRSLSGNLYRVVECIDGFFSSETPEGECIIESTSIKPYYQLSVNGDSNCLQKCSNGNMYYVHFLNTRLSQLALHLFEDESIPQVNPIRENVGGCVNNLVKMLFECKCLTNYQISVTKEFHDIVSEILQHLVDPGDEETQKREHFTAVLFLSKFHPDTAPFYLAFLFNKYNIQPNTTTSYRFDIRSAVRHNSNSFVPEGIDGAVENFGPLSGHEDELFSNIFNLVLHNKCNLYDIGTKYYSEKGERCITGLCFFCVSLYCYLQLENEK